MTECIGPTWFTHWGDQTLWLPGSMWNGQAFTQYKMWDGRQWQESCLVGALGPNNRLLGVDQLDTSIIVTPYQFDRAVTVGVTSDGNLIQVLYFIDPDNWSYSTYTYYVIVEPYPATESRVSKVLRVLETLPYGEFYVFPLSQHSTGINVWFERMYSGGPYHRICTWDGTNISHSNIGPNSFTEIETYTSRNGNSNYGTLNECYLPDVSIDGLWHTPTVAASVNRNTGVVSAPITYAYSAQQGSPWRDGRIYRQFVVMPSANRVIAHNRSPVTWTKRFTVTSWNTAGYDVNSKSGYWNANLNETGETRTSTLPRINCRIARTHPTNAGQTWDDIQEWYGQGYPSGTVTIEGQTFDISNQTGAVDWDYEWKGDHYDAWWYFLIDQRINLPTGSFQLDASVSGSEWYIGELRFDGVLISPTANIFIDWDNTHYGSNTLQLIGPSGVLSSVPFDKVGQYQVNSAMAYDENKVFFAQMHYEPWDDWRASLPPDTNYPDKQDKLYYCTLSVDNDVLSWGTKYEYDLPSNFDWYGNYESDIRLGIFNNKIFIHPHGSHIRTPASNIDGLNGPVGVVWVNATTGSATPSQETDPVCSGGYNVWSISDDKFVCDYMERWGPRTAGPPVFAASDPPDGVEQVSYSYTFTVSNGSATYQVSSGSLPPGLVLSSDGVLSGTPTQSGTYTFSVSANNGHGTTISGPHTIIIIPPTETVLSHWNFTYSDNGNSDYDTINSIDGELQMDMTIDATSADTFSWGSGTLTMAGTPSEWWGAGAHGSEWASGEVNGFTAKFRIDQFPTNIPYEYEGEVFNSIFEIGGRSYYRYSQSGYELDRFAISLDYDGDLTFSYLFTGYYGPFIKVDIVKVPKAEVPTGFITIDWDFDNTQNITIKMNNSILISGYALNTNGQGLPTWSGGVDGGFVASLGKSYAGGEIGTVTYDDIIVYGNVAGGGGG